MVVMSRFHGCRALPATLLPWRQSSSLSSTLSPSADTDPFTFPGVPHMAQFEVSDIVRALHAVRDEWRDSQRRSREPGTREFPSRDALAQVIDSLKGALFPMRLGPPDLRHESEDFYVG